MDQNKEESSTSKQNSLPRLLSTGEPSAAAALTSTSSPQKPRKSVDFSKIETAANTTNQNTNQNTNANNNKQKRGHTRSRSLSESSTKEKRMEEVKSQMDSFISRASSFRKLHLSNVVEAALQNNLIVPATPSPRGPASSSSPITIPLLKLPDSSSTGSQSPFAVPPPSPTHSPRIHNPSLNFTPSQITLVLQGEPVLLNTFISDKPNEKYSIMVSAGTTLVEISKLIKEQVPRLWNDSTKWNLILEGQRWNGEEGGAGDRDLKLLAINEVRVKYMDEEPITVEIEIVNANNNNSNNNSNSNNNNNNNNKSNDEEIKVLANRMSGWQRRMWKLQSKMRTYLEALDAEWDEISESNLEANNTNPTTLTPNNNPNPNPNLRQEQVERMIVMLQGLVECAPIAPPKEGEGEED